MNIRSSSDRRENERDFQGNLSILVRLYCLDRNECSFREKRKTKQHMRRRRRRSSNSLPSLSVRKISLAIELSDRIELKDKLLFEGKGRCARASDR